MQREELSTLCPRCYQQEGTAPISRRSTFAAALLLLCSATSRAMRCWRRSPGCFFAEGVLADGAQPGEADERDAEAKADGNEPKFGTGAADDQQRAS